MSVQTRTHIHTLSVILQLPDNIPWATASEAELQAFATQMEDFVEAQNPALANRTACPFKVGHTSLTGAS